jgi:nucleoside phosphorylase
LTRPRIADADVVVLTPLSLEYQAVLAHLTDTRSRIDANGTHYEIGELRGSRCRVALALIGPGNLAAAALTGRAIESFRPIALLLVGVAGGLTGEVALGDVVVATWVFAYHGGRAESSRFRPRPKGWQLSHSLEQQAHEVVRAGTWTSLLPGIGDPPTVHFKPLVSGDVVVDSLKSPTATLIADHYSDAIAVDMESAGVAEAAHRNDFHYAITIRAVSDHADGNKQVTDAAGWQPRAVANAAAFAVALADRIVQGPNGMRPALSVRASPYRGLAAFRERDAELFFGRAELAGELADLVSRCRFVAVTGRSGIGKSSLVNAGLVPGMRRREWAIVSFRPLPGVPASVAVAGGLLPLLRPGLAHADALPHRASLAEAIAGGRLAELVGDALAETGASRLLVCVDQFEEFAAGSEAAARELASLLLQLSTGHGRAHVVLTMRADLLDIAVNRLGLGEVARNSVFLVTPMTAEQMRAAIVSPAEHAGVTFEPGLAERILESARDAPAALTLMQFALTRLWDEQDRGRLTHSAYNGFGGVGGALASYAERVWSEDLDDAERIQARRVLAQLVSLRGDEVVRRTARSGDLPAAVVPLARRLATTRLVVIGSDDAGEITFDLAHAALAEHWQRLRDWLNEDRDFRTWQEDLRESMRRAEPLHSTRLTDALRWLRTHPHDIPDPERDFITASRSRRRRRTAAWRTVLALIVTLGVVAGIFAVNLQQRTTELEHQLRQNAAHGLLAQARERTSSEPDTAALLAVAAHQSDPTPAAQASLAGEYLRYRSTNLLIDPGVADVTDVAISADRRTIAAVGLGGAAVLRMDRQPVKPEQHGQDLRQIALSPDGRLLAGATNQGRVEVRQLDGGVTVLHDAGEQYNRPLVLQFDERSRRLLAVFPGAARWCGTSSATSACPSRRARSNKPSFSSPRCGSGRMGTTSSWPPAASSPSGGWHPTRLPSGSRWELRPTRQSVATGVRRSPAAPGRSWHGTSPPGRSATGARPRGLPARQ